MFLPNMPLRLKTKIFLRLAQQNLIRMLSVIIGGLKKPPSAHSAIKPIFVNCGSDGWLSSKFFIQYILKATSYRWNSLWKWVLQISFITKTKASEVLPVFLFSNLWINHSKGGRRSRYSGKREQNLFRWTQNTIFNSSFFSFPSYLVVYCWPV